MVRREALNDIKIEIEKIINDIIKQVKDGRIESESSITDRFVQKLQDFRFMEIYVQGNQLNVINFQFVIQIRTLGDRGKSSSESKYGADICLVMEVNDEEKRRKKGILIQSKISNEPIKVKQKKNTYIQVNLKTKKFELLNSQLQKMSRITPENYILVYDDIGFFIIKANHVIDPDETKKSISIKADKFEDFLTLMIKCLRGDTELTDWQDDYFEGLIERRLAKYYVHIKIFQNRW